MAGQGIRICTPFVTLEASQDSRYNMIYTLPAWQLARMVLPQLFDSVSLTYLKR